MRRYFDKFNTQLVTFEYVTRGLFFSTSSPSFNEMARPPFDWPVFPKIQKARLKLNIT